MPLPFVIDNQEHRLADVLKELLAGSRGRPLDVATAYFSISGYRLLHEGLHGLGAFRLLLGADPQSGADIGLRPSERDVLAARLKGDLEAEAFTPETLRLVEELIAFLRGEKVEVRLFSKGFLHAKAYLFHHDAIGPQNRVDRLRPFAAIVGSSNFTGPGLTSTRELNLVQRVITPKKRRWMRRRRDVTTLCLFVSTTCLHKRGPSVILAERGNAADCRVDNFFAR